MNEGDLTHKLLSVCHSFSEEVDVQSLLAIWLAVNPCGSDVAIQIQTHVFSTSDGGVPISAIAHFRSMVEKVDGLVQIGHRVEGILEVLQENFEVIQKVRELVYTSFDLEMPDVFPENDFSQRLARTESLTNAVRGIRSAPLNRVETLEEVGPAFDLERSRFFFQGRFFNHERLTVAFARGPAAAGPASVSTTAARIFASLAEFEGLEEFVVSTEFDSIVATMELAFRFYNEFLQQLERSIEYFQAMFKTYENASTFEASSSSSSSSSAYNRQKRHRVRESTLDIAIREGIFTPSSTTAPAASAAPSSAGGASSPTPTPVQAPVESMVTEEAPVEAPTTGAGGAGGAGFVTPPSTSASASASSATPKKYMPRLPAPLGFEPEVGVNAAVGGGGEEEGASEDGAGADGAGGGGGRRRSPCPVKPPCASALFARCAGFQGLFESNAFGKAAQVYARLPDDHVIRQRLDDFFQRDLRTRYFPLLAKILVNYAPRDPKVRTRRIGDMRAHHKLYVRELYLEEHKRVSAGGEVPTLEELTAPYDFTEDIRAIFAEGELRELVAQYML